MKKLGFKRSKNDPFLFITKLRSIDPMFFLVYVDGCIVVGTKKGGEVFVNIMGDLLKI